MLAATHPRYGGPDVLELEEIERPVLKATQVLVEVHASPITQGDRRLRAADYPGITKILGRLFSGLLRPRNPIPGTAFAGRIIEVGAEVTQYQCGDDVFGLVMHSTAAELLAVAEDAAMAKKPASLSYEQAAALPYGADTARFFLRDLADIQAGERVLVVGASGGVGRYAVQLAKHHGAEVTGIASAGAASLVRELGADHVLDYATEDFTAGGAQYDIIFDTSGEVGFSQARATLSEKGRYLTLYISFSVLVQMLMTKLRGGPRALFGVAMGTPESTETLRELAELGALRPVMAKRFPLSRIVEAHAFFEQPRPHGSVVVVPVGV